MSERQSSIPDTVEGEPVVDVEPATKPLTPDELREAQETRPLTADELREAEEQEKKGQEPGQVP
ncbi:MAG TPA: hypothetical protein VFA46_14720 [Actinomycetes bacterium]|jgi:hypothetical protein|nr:hypothetical protein [Actinomycetes bacterium]